MNKLIIKVEKRILLLVAAIVWLFAGSRVSLIGYSDVIENKGNLLLTILIAILVFYVFFKFIFSKMVNKHTKRIINSKEEKQFILSFFDIKSYLIMAFMITMGITVRSCGIFNAIYVGTFYMGLGTALFGAGVLFLINSLKHRKTTI